ncbi:hypothetical protein [Methylobacterium sp. GC_Met_2]|uniref:hypothetical protein n=1 Tax=Methylobacterium sp. GC_Met_2 TaxID=2937376 RepID=UPI00226BA770|nr:hypothetical protein [Methylobacterium sp. GC_Met_2]
MTSARQVRPIFDALKTKHPYLVQIGNRFAIKNPVHHIALGIFIERTSDPNCCSPRLFMTALYFAGLPGAIAIGTYFEYLSRSPTSAEKFWLWSDPTMIPEAIAVLDSVALPKLALYGTPESYATLPSRPHWVYDEPYEDRMIVHIAAGKLDAARAIWHERQPWHAGKSFPPGSRAHRWQTQLAAVEEPLMAGDRPALAKILHDWEAANVRGTELEPYWEPTPFPLER